MGNLIKGKFPGFHTPYAIGEVFLKWGIFASRGIGIYELDLEIDDHKNIQKGGSFFFYIKQGVTPFGV